jgi:hypothetical protein
MLHQLELIDLHRIADLATDARRERNGALKGLPEAEIGAPQPARGEHNPASSLGLDFLPFPSERALQSALAEIPLETKRKLWAVLRIGEGQYGKDWSRAIAAAGTLSNETTTQELLAAADLHELLMKGLYELDIR